MGIEMGMAGLTHLQVRAYTSHVAEKIVRESIAINALPSRVWDVLTRPEYTREYMFGCEPVTDWGVGSSLEWRAGEKVYVKGTVVSIEPNERFEYTTYSPNAFDNYEDTPENYTMVTLQLKPSGDGIELLVTQGDFSRIASGDIRFAHSVNSWRSVLTKIKEIAETS
jgi:uncharacterized protein YndB with AHSA1/START domain